MTREEMIDFIIDNSFRFTEKNRSLLGQLSDGDLKAVADGVTQEARNQVIDIRTNLTVSL